MEWGLLLALVAIAAVLQLMFFWYYLRLGQSGESVYASATSESTDHGTRSSGNNTVDRSPSSDDDTLVTCPNCGFDNDWEPTYSFCANCIEKLG